MSDDTTSQSQVENLLRAMEAGGSLADRRAAAATHRDGAAAVAVAKSPASPAPAVKPYDFKRPLRVGQEQLRAIEALHEPIASHFAPIAGGLLRTLVDVQMVSAEQMAYGEFLAPLTGPRCLHVLAVQPLQGHWLLDLAPSLSFAVVDRMLGGEAEPGPVIRRPLTDIENRLVGRFVTGFLGQLEQAWRHVEPLQLAVQRVENHPHAIPCLPHGDTVMVVGFEVTIGNHGGRMNLCIPFNSIESLPFQLANPGCQQPQPTAATRHVITSTLDIAAVELVVTLAKSKIRTADLLDLAVGDVITTEQDASAPLELSVQGVPKFNVHPGAYRGRKAIRVQGLIGS